MKILYIQKKNFTQFLINNFEDAKNSDLIIFAPCCFPTINLENELNKQTQTLIEVCYFSKQFKATIIIFCNIILSSENKLSQKAGIIISNGKLLGICDEIDTSRADLPASVSIYEIADKKICVLVGNNAKTVELMQIANIFNCNLIVSGVENSSRAITSLAKYYLDEFNVSTIICSKNKVEVFCKNKNVINKKFLSLITLNKLQPKKVPKFYKYIYKTIYENFN